MLFCFNVLAQLANISTKITLYELVRLSKSMREDLSEALADSEAFIPQNPAEREEENEGYYLQTSKHFPYITFTPDDMQFKEKHNRPLYYIGYIRSSEVSCIQVDLGSVLSIMYRGVISL